MTRQFQWRRDDGVFLGAEHGWVPLSSSLISEGTTIERVIVNAWAWANPVNDAVQSDINYGQAVEVTYGVDPDPPPTPPRFLEVAGSLDDRDFLALLGYGFTRVADSQYGFVLLPPSGNLSIDTGTRRRVPAGQTAQVWFGFDQSRTVGGAWIWHWITSVLLSWDA